MDKTPDEIKKGLGMCIMRDCTWQQSVCPYRQEDDLCIQRICADARSYIHRLEVQRDAANGEAAVLERLVNRLRERVQQLEAEREDLIKVAGTSDGPCAVCKHYNAHESECEANEYLCHSCIADCACKECYNACHYEWRGVQKEE